MAMKERPTKADLITIIEDMLSRRLGIVKPELIDYSLNEYAVIEGKLDNQEDFLGYDMSLMKRAIHRVGNAEAITKLDVTSQLILATTRKPEDKKKAKKPLKHENTKTINNSEQLDLTEIDDT